ncbi:phycobilisome rod-core linker polypeptide [Synechococcus sp. AH-601-J22]|nr:phycobilisome rod-core linker polypeptide [Synechococcus sp. AH-601-J22]
MISSQSIITKFGGERTTSDPSKFDRKSPIKIASTSADFLQASCEKLSLPMGPRLHEECETKVPRGELADSSSEACQKAIEAAYAHVYGNAHLMDYERSVELESQLLNGEIAIKDFVKGIAKSEFYQRNFYANCSPMRTIELDFKHLLGRVPYSQLEISKFIALQAESGHGAVIDAMVDSAEYLETFGKHTVPYMRSWKSSAGAPQVTFNRTAAMSLGYAYSDKAIGVASQLNQSFSSQPNNNIVFPNGSDLEYMEMSMAWSGGRPPKIVTKIATVLTIAGLIEVTRVVAIVAFSAVAS